MSFSWWTSMVICAVVMVWRKIEIEVCLLQFVRFLASSRDFLCLYLSYFCFALILTSLDLRGVVSLPLEPRADGSSSKARHRLLCLNELQSEYLTELRAGPRTSIDSRRVCLLAEKS
jgi:hypothetical protein